MSSIEANIELATLGRISEALRLQASDNLAAAARLGLNLADLRRSLAAMRAA